MEVMEIFVLILLFLLVMTHAYRDHKDKEKATNAGWKLDCREHLRCISSMFCSECQTITKKTLKLYSQRLYRCKQDMYNRPYMYPNRSPLVSIQEQHNTAINDLEKEYLNSIIERVNKRPGMERIMELPSDLAEEYEKNIKEIASQFREIGYYLVTNPSELDE